MGGHKNFKGDIMSDFHNQRTSTARKSHICILCGQEIPVGEKYKRSTGKWSSDWIYDWLYDECCRSCSKADNCEQNVFRCGKVLDQIFKRGDKHDT